MRAFRHKTGHLAGETMSVADFREALERYPEDMPVFARWEDCNAYILPSKLFVERVSKGRWEDACECLVIDVGAY